MHIGNIETSIAIMGIETINYYKTKISCWDVGGADRIRELY